VTFFFFILTIAEKLFYHRHTPCCESIDENGFCGQVDGEGNLQYTLCDRPYKYFYWDSTNPTQAGWKAIMKQLEGPIRVYLALRHCMEEFVRLGLFRDYWACWGVN